VRVRLRQVVAVVRRHQRNPRFLRQPHQIAVHSRLHVDSLVLHFEKEIPLAENIPQPVRVRLRLVVFLVQQRRGHFPAQAGRQRNQPLAVLRQQVVVHARLVIEAVEKPRGYQLDEIPVALFVFREQNEMVRPLRFAPPVFVIVRRDVHFAPNNRFHAVRRRLVEEIRRRKQVSVVGYRHRRHPSPRGFLRQLADFARPVEQGVIRVQMQVGKILGGRRHSGLYSKPPRKPQPSPSQIPSRLCSRRLFMLTNKA